MRSRKLTRRPVLAGLSALVVMLAVELVDELADGVKGAALPLIHHGLSLSYGQMGLLASVPLLVGSLLELPIGVLAAEDARRRRVILAGGVVFTASLVAVATARSYASLLIAFVIFFPASGAFVSLTQAALMDADPGRQEQHMARWNLAGSAGAVGGPLLLAGVLAAGGSWRMGYLLVAACAAAAWVGVAGAGVSGRKAIPRGAQGRTARADKDGPQPGGPRPEGGGSRPESGPRPDGGPGPGSGPGPDGRARTAGKLLGLLRHRAALRWAALLQVSDLLLDVLTGFGALYLVDVVHATPSQAALGVAVRYAAALAGDVLVIRALDHVGGVTILRASAAAASLLYPGFLLVPGLWAKLGVLAVLTVATSSWYPVMQAQLYRSLPGESGLAVSLSSAATALGGLGPLAVGFIAQRAGLAVALAVLAAVPPCLVLALGRTAAAGRTTAM